MYGHRTQVWKGDAVSKQSKMRYSPNEKGYKSKTFQLRLSQETYNKLERLAQKAEMSKSNYIRYLIEKQK